jgi:hypothetical protein
VPELVAVPESVAIVPSCTIQIRTYS